MAGGNVEIVRRVYAAIPERDWDALGDLLHPHAELIPPASVPDFQPYRGTEGLRRYQEQTEQVWERFETWPEEMIESGDRVLALARTRALGRGSRVEVEIEVGHLWSLEAGRVARLEIFTDRDEARAALRLESRARHTEEDPK